ncbi:hypothetical protein ACFVIY_37875 [Streptomyces sp. NPDC127166]|uniref:hypothetical protein n=1 Tax=Streptomyces sp. NPDC127166 TaxID=3345380 RepID=UPI00362B5A54
MSHDEQRAALDALAQLALEHGEFTWDPDSEPDPDDIDMLIDLAGIPTYDDVPEAPLRYVDSVRPANRPPQLADKYSALRRIRPMTVLPPLDDYQPPTAA